MRYKKEDEVKMTKYLRFRNYDPATSQKTYMTHRAIAKFLNRSQSYVLVLCNKIIQQSKDITSERII